MNNSLEPLTKISSPAAQGSESPHALYEVRTNGKKKSYVCSYHDCGKEFKYKSEVYRHVATHQSQRPHVCPHEGCHKGFKRADALENHVRTHTKEAPYMCKVENCGKTFTTKASLRYHTLKHEDQKVHMCKFPGCNKAFITIFQLKQHEKSTCVHKKITFGNDLTNSVINNSNSNSINNAHHNAEAVEVPPFFRNTGIESNSKMLGSNNRVQDVSQEAFVGERIRDIINENSLLKQRLEISTNIISFLHRKIKFDSFQVPEYPQSLQLPELMTEGFMRFPFPNNNGDA